MVHNPFHMGSVPPERRPQLHWVRQETEARGTGVRRPAGSGAVAVFHDEVEIEDFQYDEDSESYFYPCPCGDNFWITKEDLENVDEVATCPSCSLVTKVIYDQDQFMCAETVPAPSANIKLVKC
ncbi:PREDICTED: DPH3 homolog [Elephantulus edwardii]|uniref:DPH3 homolog n=1 Tax=Elephantulus edwardii TaxID=28737 RepID=UPI0003F08E2A|nr:PREDICTED: DPH3 homolog [Elephantulus edwardii]